jgi:hypothetical protein
MQLELYDEKMPAEATFKAAMAMFTNGRDPKKQDEWRKGFADDMLYITAGRLPFLSGFANGKKAVIEELEGKEKMAPKLTFDIFPLVLTQGNMAITFVNNKTPTGPNFVLAGLTFFKKTEVKNPDGSVQKNPDGTDKTVIQATCNIDLYSSDDSLGAILANSCYSLANWFGRCCRIC